MKLVSPTILFFLFLFFFPYSLSLQLCSDSRAPMTLKTPLEFCSYSGSSCCNATDDSAFQKQFNSMNISDPSCASLVRSILCAKCNPFAADLFDFEPKIRTVPILCNSSVSASSVQSKKDTSGVFCTQVWNACRDTPILNSPFAPVSQGPGSSSKITDLWRSESDFCSAFGGSSSDDSLCFNGSSAAFNVTATPATPSGLCLEKIGNGSYLNMAAHPDGSNRAFFADQPGKIWLATVPAQGSGETLSFAVSSPFLDITDVVLYDSTFGVMGMAFHPNFATNGRFFVSYNCDKVQSAGCSGRCSCNSDVDCDPSKLSPDNRYQPCQVNTVVAEYSANSSSSAPSMATSASSSVVRTIFTMGLPFKSQHGGQILFGPQDGYLYFMMGDGGGKGGDPYNFAQNKNSLLGKIMRLDINNIPSQSEIDDLGLWGYYSIPKDNPSAGDQDLQPEIWALGLRNPWRCSFDAQRPSYFICADVGQDKYEEVDLISKGGNYGWRDYEGPLVFNTSSTPGVNTSAASENVIFPVMGYTHSALNNSVGSAAITGGYVYRSTTDPCMFGRYLFSDLYAGAMWAGTETPDNSGNYSSTMIPFGCSKQSPIPCDTVAGTSVLSLGYIYSFGEDNNRDVFILASKGVYRVVPPSRCDYVCPLEKPSNGGNPSPGPSSSAGQLESPQTVLRMLVALSLLLMLGL